MQDEVIGGEDEEDVEQQPEITIEEMKAVHEKYMPKFERDEQIVPDARYALPNENWKDCPSWLGYQASDHGRIMSPRGKVLLLHKNNLGYLKAAGIGREHKAQSVHRIVADAWLGACPDGREVDHKDHDKTNNKPSNLQYITHQANIIRARDAGRFPDMSGSHSHMFGKKTSPETRLMQSLAKRGDKHWRAVKPDVAKIRELRETGLSDARIAKQLGLKRTVVGCVLRGTHWSVRTDYRDVAFPKDAEPCQ